MMERLPNWSFWFDHHDKLDLGLLRFLTAAPPDSWPVHEPSMSRERLAVPAEAISARFQQMNLHLEKSRSKCQGYVAGREISRRCEGLYLVDASDARGICSAGKRQVHLDSHQR